MVEVDAAVKLTEFCISLTCKVPNFKTLGALAVPPKSPASIIFPFTVVVASATEFVIAVGSAITFFTNAVVATAVVLSVVVMVDATTFVPKLTAPVKVGEAKGAFKSKAVCVNVEMGFAKSEVLLIFPIPKFVKAFIAFAAPVPPFAIATIPLTFVAVPLNVPANNVEVTLLAVISPAAKLPLPSLATTVFGILVDAVFKNCDPPGKV